MKTVNELIQHMQKQDANNIFVIGPFIGNYEIMSEEEATIFSLKGLVKQKDAFFETYRKVITPADKLMLKLSAIKSMINKIYAQTINPMFAPISTEDCAIETHYIKGNAMHFKCSSCHKKYDYKHVILNKEHMCECGRHIRPVCLLTGEKYDLEKIETYENDILKSTTIFLIGFDFNELELCKQLEVIAANKRSGNRNMPTVVVVGECDKEAVYETFLPEFIVDEKPESALDRLISAISISMEV